MANPTVQNLVDRVRGLIHEKTGRFWGDTEQELLGWVTASLEAYHNELKARLQGAIPPFDHPYWRQYGIDGAIVVSAAGGNDYDLPGWTAGVVTAEANYFDLLHSAVMATGEHLTPFRLEEELMIRRGMSYGHRAGGRYAFLPGAKVRVFLSLGVSGTPVTGSRAVQWRYFRGIKHHAALADVVDMRHEFTDGPVFHASAKAMASRRISPNPFYALYKDSLERVPR